MIFLIIACLSAGAVIGFITAALLQAGADRRSEPPHTEPTKLLTVGCSVKFRGRVWEIKRFMVDSENQTIAVLESKGDGEIILRRTMAAVEELEASE